MLKKLKRKQYFVLYAFLGFKGKIKEKKTFYSINFTVNYLILIYWENANTEGVCTPENRDPTAS